jgi:hypothetical protein
MKTKFLSFLTFALFIVGVSAEELIYNNTTSPAGKVFRSEYEFGDEVTFKSPGPWELKSFAFEYFGTSFSGNEFARIRFYQNNGSGGAGRPTPATLLWDSELFEIYPSLGATKAWNEILFNNAPVVVANGLTWTVEFLGIEPGESAGLSVYSPPTVGSNSPDYWEKEGGTNWLLRAESANNDFGAYFTAEQKGSIAIFNIVSLEVLSTNIVLTWDSLGGHQYQIQRSADLVDWFGEFPSVIAPGLITRWTNSFSSGPARFYRVLKF